ncbi:hypothetical protein, unlikely [Trypanosoma congolense IL3000]|uniref:Uncharacterized protein n=1 Tax=Trypanosoma congolense (strain IL3000) TaxID=1068625 RepID=F9W928_TRYCI|nr:hypothetical protein, unlikely [Trypanosoma congolense IL3000]
MQFEEEFHSTGNDGNSMPHNTFSRYYCFHYCIHSQKIPLLRGNIFSPRNKCPCYGNPLWGYVWSDHGSSIIKPLSLRSTLFLGEVFGNNLEKGFMSEAHWSSSWKILGDLFLGYVWWWG